MYLQLGSQEARMRLIPTGLNREFKLLRKENINQFSSVTQWCLPLCDPMECSTPGFSVHYQLPEPTQTHVHCVSDATQTSHPLSSLSAPTINLSQHQSLFQ